MTLRLLRAALLTLGAIFAFLIISTATAQAGSVFTSPSEGGGDPSGGTDPWKPTGSGSGGAGTADYTIRSVWNKRFPYSWRKNNKVPAPMGLYDNGYTRVGPNGSANPSNPLMSKEMKRQYRVNKNYKCWNRTSTHVARIDNGNSEQSFALGIKWTQRITWKSLSSGRLYAAKATMRNVDCKHGSKMGVKWRQCPVQVSYAGYIGPWGTGLPKPGNPTQTHNITKQNAQRFPLNIQRYVDNTDTRFGRQYLAGFPGADSTRKINITKNCGSLNATLTAFDVGGDKDDVSTMGNYEDDIRSSMAMCSWAKYNRWTYAYTQQGATSATTTSSSKTFANDRQNSGAHRNKQWIGCVDKNSSYSTKKRAANAYGFSMTKLNNKLADANATKKDQWLFYWACEYEHGTDLHTVDGMIRLSYNTNDSFADYIHHKCWMAWTAPLFGECVVEDPTPKIRVYEMQPNGRYGWSLNNNKAVLFANGKKTEISYPKPTFTRNPNTSPEDFKEILSTVKDKKTSYEANFTGRYKNKTGLAPTDPFKSNVNLRTGGSVPGWGFASPLKIQFYTTPGRNSEGKAPKQRIKVTHTFTAKDAAKKTHWVWDRWKQKWIGETKLVEGERKTLTCQPLTARITVLDIRESN